MAAGEPMTQTMNIDDAGREFGELVRKVSGKEARVVVQENGTAVAAIVSAEDLERLEQLDAPGATQPEESAANTPRPLRGSLTLDDPLFRLVGIGKSGISGGVSGKKHEYLARAYRHD